MPGGDDARLQTARRGRIALEMPRVDFDAFDRAGRTESDDGPVVAAAATATRFPTVGHASGFARHDQIVAMAEKHVARGDDDAALLDRGEIHLSAPPDTLPLGDHFLPDRTGGVDQPILAAEKLVVRGNDRRAESVGSEIDEFEKWLAHSRHPVPRCISRLSAHTLTPLTYVAPTVPRSTRFA